MAKLNGVTTVSERIQYNGAEYVRTDEAAVVGDIIRFDDDSSYMTTNAYYEVTRIDSFNDPQVIDNDGDELDLCGNDFTVFKRIQADVAQADSDIVTHEGVKYRKVTREAVEGDLIIVTQWNSSDHIYHDVSVGEIFTAKTVSRDGRVPYVKERHINAVITLHEYAVLEPDTDAVTLESTSPTALPDAYVIHDGKVYVKEVRQANVGDTILVTGNSCNHGYSTGDIKVAEERYDNGGYRKGVDCDKAYNRSQVRDTDYVVLVPTDSVTIDGVEYSLEKRKAAKGESVLAVVAERDSLGSFSVGDIGTVTGRSGWVTEDTHVNFVNGKSKYIGPSASNSEYLVLTPKAAAKPQYREEEKPTFTEVKRKANVSERIRIVNPSMAFDYEKGDEFVVTEVDGEGDARFTDKAGERNTAFLSEYVVLEPVQSVKQATIPADPRLAKRKNVKVGDYVKITQDQHAAPVGSIVKVTRVNGSTVTYQWDGHGGWVSDKFEPITQAEAEYSSKVGDYKVGDFAKLLDLYGAVAGFEIGDYVEVVKYSDGTRKLGIRNASTVLGFVDAPSLKRVSAEEFAQARKESEATAKQRAEETKWSAIGRKVGEFKAGDIVRVTRGRILPVGTVGTVVDQPSDWIGGKRIAVKSTNRGALTDCTGDVELIAPVELLFNA